MEKSVNNNSSKIEEKNNDYPRLNEGIDGEGRFYYFVDNKGNRSERFYQRRVTKTKPSDCKSKLSEDVRFTVRPYKNGFAVIKKETYTKYICKPDLIVIDKDGKFHLKASGDLYDEHFSKTGSTFFVKREKAELLKNLKYYNVGDDLCVSLDYDTGTEYEAYNGQMRKVKDKVQAVFNSCFDTDKKVEYFYRDLEGNLSEAFDKAEDYIENRAIVEKHGSKYIRYADGRLSKGFKEINICKDGYDLVKDCIDRYYIMDKDEKLSEPYNFATKSKKGLSLVQKVEDGSFFVRDNKNGQLRDTKYGPETKIYLYDEKLGEDLPVILITKDIDENVVYMENLETGAKSNPFKYIGVHFNEITDRYIIASKDRPSGEEAFITEFVEVKNDRGKPLYGKKYYNAQKIYCFLDENCKESEFYYDILSNYKKYGDKEYAIVATEPLECRYRDIDGRLSKESFSIPYVYESKKMPDPNTLEFEESQETSTEENKVAESRIDKYLKNEIDVYALTGEDILNNLDKIKKHAMYNYLHARDHCRNKQERQALNDIVEDEFDYIRYSSYMAYIQAKKNQNSQQPEEDDVEILKI